jgi:hypothetical protein
MACFQSIRELPGINTRGWALIICSDHPVKRQNNAYKSEIIFTHKQHGETRKLALVGGAHILDM